MTAEYDDVDDAWRTQQELEDADLSEDRDAAISLLRALEEVLDETYDKDGYTVGSPEVQTRLRQFAAASRLLGYDFDDFVRPEDYRLLGVRKRAR